jgi:hypothetical protein
MYRAHVQEYLLVYTGFGTSIGVCHVVLSRSPEEAMVLVGQLEDNPGTSVTNAIERVAERISTNLLDGREAFELFEYFPGGGIVIPRFARVTWEGGKPFYMPVWHEIEPISHPWLEVAARRVGQEPYTTESIHATVVDATDRPDIVSRLLKRSD